MIVLLQEVKKAIQGDKESFAKLIKNRQNDIYKVAYSYVNNESDALDIVQEAVYKAYISINKLKHPEYFNTWLTRIVINCSIHFINKSKKVMYLDKEMSETLSGDSINIESYIDLKRAVKSLDTKYKTVVILKYFRDFKLSEIANILGIPINTVKIQLHRAIKELKIQLKEGDFIEE